MKNKPKPKAVAKILFAAIMDSIEGSAIFHYKVIDELRVLLTDENNKIKKYLTLSN